MTKLKPNQFILSGHLITELPILFQTEMVRSILSDRKTQTRRLVKGFDVFSPEFIAREFEAFSRYGKLGDLLWVRESYQSGNRKIYYKSDLDEQLSKEVSALGATWKPSIQMPKQASRLWLMVEEIRVERVQDISEADAIAEGIEMRAVIDPEFEEPVRGWKDYQTNDWITTGDGLKSPEERSFKSLWKSINGEESWNSNPWVWVIKFRVLSKTGRPSDAVILENYLEVTGKEVENG